MPLLQDILLVLGSAIISSALILASARKLKDAQTVVRAVITTYGQRLARQEEAHQATSAEVGRLRNCYERLESRLDRSSELGKQTTVTTSELTQALKETSLNLRVLNEALRIHEEVPLEPALPARTRVGALELTVKRSGQEVTPTEICTLKILATEGPKTSTELHERVGRSREHFARLMKRLYERGYVDRDSSKTPFIYKINESVAQKVSEETEENTV